MICWLWLLSVFCTTASASLCCENYSISYVYVPPQTIGYYRIPIYQHVRRPLPESYYAMPRPSTYAPLPPTYAYLPRSNYVPYESRPNPLTFDYSSPPGTYRRELLEQDLFLRRSGVPYELLDSEISMNEVRRSTTAEDAVDDFASPTGFRLRRVKL